MFFLKIFNKGSQKKWDEAIWHSVLIPNQMILATGKFIFKIFQIKKIPIKIKLF